MSPYNSTIQLKQKTCISCGKPCYWFSKKRCQQCAKVEDFHAKNIAAMQQEDGLPELIDRLDGLISKWVRYSVMGSDGLTECYTCGKRFKPSDLDAGHYRPRACQFLRFDLRNIKPQCRSDNRAKYGMAAQFGKRLEEENGGITEILLEESKIIHHWTREELKQMILEYEGKVASLKIK